MNLRRILVAIVLAIVLPRLAAAQTLEDYDYENLAFRGVGLDFGVVWPAQVERALTLGLRADLGFAGPQVRVMPALRYWSSTLESREVNQLAAQISELCFDQGFTCPVSLGEIDRSDLELSVDAHYLFQTGYTAYPYLGGGVSLHLLNGRGAAIDDTFVEDLLDTISPGLNAVGGVNLELGDAFQLFAEARYVLVSDVRYGGLMIGGVWLLPSPVAPRSLRPGTGAGR